MRENVMYRNGYEAKNCVSTVSTENEYVQRSPLFCANIVKKDPGIARQKSLATARTNFTKPGAHNKGDLCTYVRTHEITFGILLIRRPVCTWLYTVETNNN